MPERRPVPLLSGMLDVAAVYRATFFPSTTYMPWGSDCRKRSTSLRFTVATFVPRRVWMETVSPRFALGVSMAVASLMVKQ